MSELLIEERTFLVISLVIRLKATASFPLGQLKELPETIQNAPKSINSYLDRMSTNEVPLVLNGFQYTLTIMELPNYQYKSKNHSKIQEASIQTIPKSYYLKKRLKVVRKYDSIEFLFQHVADYNKQINTFPL